MKVEKSAFPYKEPASSYEAENCRGMSLRDWFAGQALSGYSVYVPECGGIVPKTAAAWCYELADAMLEARKDNNDSL